VANSGSAAGTGVAEIVPSPPRKLQERSGGQTTNSTAVIASEIAGTNSEPEFKVSVREIVEVVSRKLTSVEVMLDPTRPVYNDPGKTEPAVVERLTDKSDAAVVSTVKRPPTLPPSPRTTDTSQVIVAAFVGLICANVSDAPTAAIANKFLKVMMARQWPP
jgi:hypothetical protein